MRDQFPASQEQVAVSSNAVKAATHTLATEFHEDWRKKTRLNGGGSFEPCIKPTDDAAWIEAHGTDQVDIANTDYDELPTDWQAENKAAAEVVVGVMVEYNGAIDLSSKDVRSQVGGTIHDAWLSRNDWAKGGELDVPFTQLSAEEQVKDIAQVEVAQRVFGQSLTIPRS
jgi:hypothetical protein